MQWYSPDESGILQQARGGDIPGAFAALEELEPSLSHARYTLVNGILRVWSDVASRNSVLDDFICALKDAHNDPATYMMLLVQAAAYAYEGNKGKAMRDLVFRFNQVGLMFPGHEAVVYWRGAFLINQANYLVRRQQWEQAMSAIDQGLACVDRTSEHWCHYTRGQVLRAWCLTELGQLSEAKRALQRLRESDRKSSHLADYLLGLSRVFLATKDYRRARICAVQAKARAKDNSPIDWQVVIEATYQELLVVIKSGTGDGLAQAQEVGALAHKHGIGYILNMVQTALLDTTSTRKEETV